MDLIVFTVCEPEYMNMGPLNYRSSAVPVYVALRTQCWMNLPVTSDFAGYIGYRTYVGNILVYNGFRIFLGSIYEDSSSVLLAFHPLKNQRLRIFY